MKYFYAPTLAILVVVLSATGTLAQANNSENPMVVAAVAPVYPAAALAMNLEGSFQVDVKIDRKGKVVSSKAVEGTHRLMQKAIELAADQWLFVADEDAPKRRHARLTFIFRRTPDARSTESTPVFYPPYKIEVRTHVVIAAAR